MIKREFRIENFKTLGISKPCDLELGAASKSGNSLGGIVILIGQNNAGKSNIISAMKAFSEKNIGIENKPRFLTDNSIEPKVKYIFKDDENAFFVKSIKGKYEIDVSPETEKMILANNKLKSSVYTLNTENSKRAVKGMVEFSEKYQGNSGTEILADWGKKNGFPSINLNQFGVPSNQVKYFEALLTQLAIIDKESIKEVNINDFIAPIAETLNNIQIGSILTFANRVLKIEELDLKLLYKDLGLIATNEVNKEQRINEYFLEKYNMNLVPQITFYDDRNGFNSSHLITQVSEGKIQNPIFFSKMFDLLENTSFKSISDAYLSFHKGGEKNKGPLYSIKKILSQDIEKLSKQFNQIYTGNPKGQYSFDVDFESKRIDFIILENGEPVYYDDQSSGFKWFFNFFFNVIANKLATPGSIVLMDEPATNLHVIGQVELRELIKKYGIENNVLFVISTHSPFFVDINHLDELRLVRKVDRESIIDNKFTHLIGEDIDTLLPVYSALTVGKHILLNPKSLNIFVEGITDYNYLCAFKFMLGVEDINFLPIQGVGKDNQQEKIFKKLLKITPTPIVLVDGDYAGNSFKNKNEYNTIEIITLKEINETYKTIETLFDKKDLQENPLIANKIEPYLSSIEFKNSVKYNKKTVSKKTISNFEELFKRLES